jgi:hypothetical protein
MQAVHHPNSSHVPAGTTTKQNEMHLMAVEHRMSATQLALSGNHAKR